ncbi:hypothetical protein J2Z50_002218 [Ensifer mexicanus]|nr:hypothetical protein [Sinorhizobium mexicanum]
MLLQQPHQQSFGSLGIATGLDDLVENVAILVDGTPQPMFSAAYGNHDLVQMPNSFPRRLLSTQLLGVGCPEFAAPSPDRFVRDDNAAHQQHFLD